MVDEWAMMLVDRRAILMVGEMVGCLADALAEMRVVWMVARTVFLLVAVKAGLRAVSLASSRVAKKVVDLVVSRVVRWAAS